MGSAVLLPIIYAVRSLKSANISCLAQSFPFLRVFLNVLQVLRRNSFSSIPGKPHGPLVFGRKICFLCVNVKWSLSYSTTCFFVVHSLRLITLFSAHIDLKCRHNVDPKIKSFLRLLFAKIRVIRSTTRFSHQYFKTSNCLKIV